jgi:hypothetical protein
MVASFEKGLAKEGYNEGLNFSIEYRWAKGQPDRNR